MSSASASTAPLAAIQESESPALPRGFQSWLQSLKTFSKAPLFFFGLGLYRAWIELVYVRPMLPTPAWSIAGHDVFDISMVLTLILAAICARRLVPLYHKRLFCGAAIALMVLGTALNFCTLLPGLADFSGSVVMAWVAAIASGVGTGIIILLWSELYSCLNPLRVAFYYSGSLIFAALVIFLCMGLVQSYYIALVLLLPLLSLLMLYRSYAFVSPESLPRPNWQRVSFPWKPAALMAVYGFAYGLQEAHLYAFTGPHSSIGAIIAASVVFFGMLLLPKRFSMAVTYRIALPVLVCGFLLIPSFSPDNEFANTCVAMSFTSFSILIMLILSSISYRFGIGAVWLFGIERGFRAFFMFLGRHASEQADQLVAAGLLNPLIITAVVVVLVVLATMILLSERELSSKWGISFRQGAMEQEQDVMRQHLLADVCTRLATEHNLSSRESEVLLLLARQRELTDIETELFIAKGTVKAHVQHIYQKLNIHSRQELYELLEK
jgi:DNA-binding CsgD family transcriptional regulator